MLNDRGGAARGALADLLAMKNIVPNSNICRVSQRQFESAGRNCFPAGICNQVGEATVSWLYYQHFSIEVGSAELKKTLSDANHSLPKDG